LADLTPVMARQNDVEITFSGKWSPRTRAKDGQVEPVMGVFFYLLICQVVFF
jgi:hypothetical protein